MTGHGSDFVKAHLETLELKCDIVHQSEQLGTAHAVEQARPLLETHEGYTLILYADTPFIKAETCEKLIDTLKKGASVAVLGFDAEIPGGYGRLKMGDDGLEAIIEAKDATETERAISLCNSGVLAAKSEVLFNLIAKVENNNASHEYYLTDIIKIARHEGLKASVVVCDESEVMGVNSRVDLAKAEEAFQREAREKAMLNGATLRSPQSCYFSYDTHIGSDVIIEPYVTFGVGVTVEDDVHIKSHSHLDGAIVKKGAIIGPYARLRPGADIGEKARVGNFVEIKNSTLKREAKVNHLTYIGDSEIGEEANIGAGTITCNYDGVFKYKTKIGARAFIGSNSALIAPVDIGDDALIASGSVITENVPNGDLAIARSKQKNLLKSGFKIYAKITP